MASSPFVAVIAGRSPEFLAVLPDDGTGVQRFSLAITDVTSLNHLVIFTTELHAAVYFLLPSSSDWRQLGALSSSKPSAIFALKNLVSLSSTASAPSFAAPTVPSGGAVLGIALEPGPPPAENSLVLASARRPLPQDPVRLGTKIAEHIYTYASSFAKPFGPAGETVVELSTISRWVGVFEQKVRNSGGLAFLEQD